LESSGCCCESLNEVATGVDHGKHLRMIARALTEAGATPE
jgi:hypothetical protein